jgi:hypothetical protein
MPDDKFELRRERFRHNGDDYEAIAYLDGRDYCVIVCRGGKQIGQPHHATMGELMQSGGIQAGLADVMALVKFELFGIPRKR